MTGPELVTAGKVVGLFGVRGWIKVHSYTRPRDAILNYKPWWIRGPEGWMRVDLEDGRVQGKGIVALLRGYSDRDRARGLIGADIAVEMSRLPPLKEGEYYWAQLEGLRVVNLEGQVLGAVSHLFETGANDVMVVTSGPELTAGPGREAKQAQRARERLIPFTAKVVKRVDLTAGVIEVDWGLED